LPYDDFAIGAVTVPTVSARSHSPRIHKLDASQESVVVRHENAGSANLNLDKAVKPAEYSVSPRW